MKIAELRTKLERADELEHDLARARHTLSAFEQAPSETLPTYCSVNHGMHRVELLPVPKSQAVSAAKREVSKIIEALAHLGVEVDEQEAPAVGAVLTGCSVRWGLGDTVGGLTVGH